MARARRAGHLVRLVQQAEGREFAGRWLCYACGTPVAPVDLPADEIDEVLRSVDLDRFGDQARAKVDAPEGYQRPPGEYRP